MISGSDCDTMSSDTKFKVGDRVRIVDYGMLGKRNQKVRFATVKQCFYNSYDILRDGMKTVTNIEPYWLEPADCVSANVYADWLEEQGFLEAANALRKGFILK